MNTYVKTYREEEMEFKNKSRENHKMFYKFVNRIIRTKENVLRLKAGTDILFVCSKMDV